MLPLSEQISTRSKPADAPRWPAGPATGAGTEAAAAAAAAGEAWVRERGAKLREGASGNAA
jgi:hypothetical protein